MRVLRSYNFEIRGLSDFSHKIIFLARIIYTALHLSTYKDSKKVSGFEGKHNSFKTEIFYPFLSTYTHVSKRVTFRIITFVLY